MRAAGQLAETGLHGVGYLPDIMNAYALSRGGPITPDGRILYPSEVTETPDGTYETAALNSLARYHPMNAANHPDVTHRQRQAYIRDVMGKGEKNQWYSSDKEAMDKDTLEWAARTGFVPKPMSKPVPQAILDAIQSQR
jgi:hypothetical protein